MNSRTTKAVLVGVAAGLLMVSSAVYADPPLESGRVIRSEWTNAYSWVDFKTGYRVVVGADIYEFCNGVINFSTFPITAVDIPTLEGLFGRWVVNGRGYMPVQVFDFIDFDCDFFLTRGPVAAGMADFHVVDNDWFGTVATNDANAWGFTVHGKITDTSTGELVMLAAKLRLMFNTRSDGVRAHSTIQLH